MAIGWKRIAESFQQHRSFRRSRSAQASVEALLLRASEEDGLSRAPAGLAERVAAAALAAPPPPLAQARRSATVDLSDFFMRPRIVGASLVSFSAGAALAVHLIYVQAGALVRMLMLGVMQSVTTGGFL